VLQKKVGVLAKEVPGGPFADEWKKAYSEVAKEQEEVDIALVISNAALAVKDEKELRLIRDASRASSGLMKDYFVEEMSSILDDEKKIGHDKLSQMVADKIDDSKFFQKIKVSNTFDSLNLDWATQPVVQSGGSYDLRFASDPDSNNLHAGVIVAALGLRYNSYSSLVARTYLVDPTKEQENNYKLLVSVHEVVLKAIRDGIQARDVYNKAIGLVKNSKKPELEKGFLKSVGYGIGIETKDTTLTLGPKSTRVLKDGMTLIVQTGFQDLENKASQSKRGKTYSLAIVDTVRVTADGTAVFTKDAPSDLDSVSFFFNDDEEPAPKPKKEKKDSRIGAVAQTNVVTKRLRTDRTANQDAEKEAHRREHQKELHQRKQQQGLDKYSKGVGTLNGTEEKKFKRFQSYKREEDFPTRVKDLMIVADTKNQSIVLPIMGRPVPFHINTIKNASTTPEGEFTSIRINFLSPGQGVGRKDDQPFEDPNAHFVRSLTYRSKDGDRMKSIAQSITDMKKENARREVEKKQLEDVVEQDKLIVDRRPQKLDLIFVRPALDGKRVPGEVQIHQNGLRYVHGGGNFSGAQTIDILSNNIRHVFFQPCKHELIVIIHIHLINPIMIGKRKTKDVQFYREATDMQFDETGNRKRKHRYGDEEEFEAEQEERRRRSELDKQFFKFAKSIEEAARDQNVRVDVPFRELGFNGVPSRSSVWIQPTTDCLVQLTEPPFMVVSLEDIEVVHLERVQVRLLNAIHLLMTPAESSL
jgi:nucleosome binding factor SPN SPT16 subunit